jgi:hypothetical protein
VSKTPNVARSRIFTLITSMFIISILIVAFPSTALYALLDLGPLLIIDREQSNGLDTASDGKTIGVAYLKQSSIFLGILDPKNGNRAEELQDRPNEIIKDVNVAPSIHIAGGMIFVVAGAQFSKCPDLDDDSCEPQQNFANPPTGIVQQTTDACIDASTSDVTASHDGDHVYFAWEDAGNICFKAQHGGEFSGNVILAANGGGSSIPMVGTSSDGKVVHVIWKSTNDEIYYSRIACDLSTQGGEKCSPSKAINLSKTNGDSHDHELVVQGSNVIVTWLDDTTGKGDPYVRISKNSGGTFGSTKILDTASSSSGPPDPAATGSKVVVCWDDKTDIFCRQSKNNGDSFANKINVSKTSKFTFLGGKSLDAQVDFTPEGQIYVAWTDILAQVTGIVINPVGTRIVVASESDDGISYSPPADLSDDPAHQFVKDIASERMNLDVTNDVATWDPSSRRG